jgi:hypothetical protein
MIALALIPLLISLLIFAIVLYVVILIVGLLPIPQPIKGIVWLVLGLIGLVVLLQHLGLNI